jgi:GNAT superfamily N-acetyltransferase
VKKYLKKESILIRSMISSDAKKIHQSLCDQGWPSDINKFNHYFEMQKNNERIIFIASDHGVVLGYVTLSLNPTYGPWKNSMTPMIIDLNVFQRYQKKGIGSLLMDAAETYAFMYAHIVTLGVGLHHGYGQAQRLYIKRGYIPEGSGIWASDEIATPYATVINDDDLNLYLYKVKR